MKTQKVDRSIWNYKDCFDQWFWQSKVIASSESIHEIHFLMNLLISIVITHCYTNFAIADMELQGLL